MMKIKLIFIILNLWFTHIEKSEKKNFEIFVDSSITDENLDFAISVYEGYYNAKIHIRKLELPRIFKSDTINAIELISYIKKNEALTFDKHIFLTGQGIALNNNANYSTRGFAFLNDNLAVISTLVISHESSNKEQFHQLFSKLLIHEMGHLYGLKHCENDTRCVMVSTLPNPQNFYDANSVLCFSCLNKIDIGIIRKKYYSKRHVH